MPKKYGVKIKNERLNILVVSANELSDLCLIASPWSFKWQLKRFRNIHTPWNDCIFIESLKLQTWNILSPNPKEYREIYKIKYI